MQDGDAYLVWSAKRCEKDMLPARDRIRRTTSGRHTDRKRPSDVLSLET